VQALVEFLCATMRILLIGNYAPDAQHSMLRFCDMLAVQLRTTGHEVQFVHPPVQLARGMNTHRGLGKWLAYIDKYILFVPLLRALARQADVVHICDHAYSLYTHCLTRVPKVVTCHDLLSVRCARGEYADQKVRWTGRKYQSMILQGLERASFIACDSGATQADLFRLTKVARDRTAVLHIGYNFPFRPLSDDERRRRLERFGIGLDDRFMIHVGADVWYKNSRGLLAIFKRLLSFPETQDLRLVTVGNSRTARRLEHDPSLQERVMAFSNISGEDLRALYSGACALLFPSLCEGFGWPIIEAQACGCPVFASDRQPMTEVGGEGAVYFNPENYEQAANIIRGHLSYASEMRKLGCLNAKRFSTEKMVRAYVKLYSGAISLEAGS
jgi:glycosyltransferase involved in cell wall biosynthesis